MTDTDRRAITQERLRTPRIAAYAGLVFAGLMGASLVIFQSSIPLEEPFQTEWLSENRTRLQVAVQLVPFAGIAFLWFMGVIRDRIGVIEDRFFSTIYLGSGLLFLATLFVWVAVIAAVLTASDASPDWIGSPSFTFGLSMVKVLGGVITLRMAGVFMFASATIWRGTSAMPRWLVWLTYALAVVLLIGGSAFRSLRLVFPAWVFLVSIIILDVAQDTLADDAEARVAEDDEQDADEEEAEREREPAE